jgi:hypothetical protein
MPFEFSTLLADVEKAVLIDAILFLVFPILSRLRKEMLYHISSPETKLMNAPLYKVKQKKR